MEINETKIVVSRR